MTDNTEHQGHERPVKSGYVALSDYHVEALNALIRYPDGEIDPATGEPKTMTACVAEAIPVGPKPESEKPGLGRDDSRRRST